MWYGVGGYVLVLPSSFVPTTNALPPPPLSFLNSPQTFDATQNVFVTVYGVCGNTVNSFILQCCNPGANPCF